MRERPIAARAGGFPLSNDNFIDIEHPESGVCVVIPRHDVDMSRSPILRSAIKDEMGSGLSKMIVDLGDVQYMDSSGLATLVEAMRGAKNANVSLYLASMNAKVRAIFEIAKLDAFFSIVDSRDEALSA